MEKIRNIPGVVKNGKVIAKVGDFVQLPIELIERDPDQPRKYFDAETIALLSDTLKDYGDVDQPLGVKFNGKKNGKVMLVWGERRWRAAGLAGLRKVSCIIQSEKDKSKLLLKSLRENLGKESMSPIEEALSVKGLMDRNQWTEKEVAKQIGVKVYVVYNLLKYLKLNSVIRKLVIMRHIEKGIALQLASLEERDQLMVLEVIKKERKIRGTAIHPNEANKIIKKTIEKMGIKYRKNKKGSRPKTYSELVCGNLLKNVRNLKSSLEDALKLTKEQLKEIDGANFVELEGELEKIPKTMKKMADKLNVLD